MTDVDDLTCLEAKARERWGDNWTIRTLRFSDGSTSSYAFRSRGIVDRDDLDEKVLEYDRLFTDDDGRLHYARIQFVDRRVIDQIDHEIVDDRGLQGDERSGSPEDHRNGPARRRDTRRLELDPEDAQMLLEAAETLAEDIVNGRQWGWDDEESRMNAEHLVNARDALRDELQETDRSDT